MKLPVLGHVADNIARLSRPHNRLAYLGVDDGHHPEAPTGPGDRQHGPEEDEDGQQESDDGGRDHVVQNDHEIAHHFRAGHQSVIHGIE